MANIKEQIREQFVSELSRSSQETVDKRLFWCTRFLQYAPDDLSLWDKNLVNRFISRLEKKYMGTTVRTAFGIVKRVFDAAKKVHERERTNLIRSIDAHDPAAVAEVLKAMTLPGPVWDMGRRDLPRGEAKPPPAFSLEEIEQIVAVAKRGELEPHEVAFTALASVYGLRRGELQAVRLEDIDYQKGTIFIWTEKGGEQRNQLLAPEIIPWLEKYDFHWEFSDWLMNKAFKNVVGKAGIGETRELGRQMWRAREGGWHRFRHFLDGVLDDAVASDPNVRKDSAIIVKVYFRWHLSTSSDMRERYYPLHPLEADQICLEHSPVVPLWKE
jgi:integrase